MKRLKYFVLAIVLVAILLPQPVRADIAPPPAPLLTGLEPFEYANTKVQMVYERVEMDVQDGPTEDNRPHDQVLVKASFVMHNQGSAPETMQSIFPADSLTSCFNYGYEGGLANLSNGGYVINSDSFQIEVDGVDVATEEVITPHPYQDKISEPDAIACETMRWVGFHVTFPVDTDVLVSVRYTMKANGDAIDNFDYVLETGAGWYGPIKQADIVVRYPYVLNKENVLEATTAGYKIAYNELLWSFQNFEPTSKDNMRVAIVSPSAWKSIRTLRQALKENPKMPEKWINLISLYDVISRWDRLGDIRAVKRSLYFYELKDPTYNQAIAANPNNADLHANYATFLLDQCCPQATRKIKDDDFNKILRQINLAFALNPEAFFAKIDVDHLKYMRPDLTFTPPATIPASATPAVSETPTITPSPSIGPFFTDTPAPLVRNVFVTVVQTRIVTTTPGDKAGPLATARSSKTPTPVVASVKDVVASPLNWLVWSVLLLIGFAGGVLVVRQKRN